MARRSIQRPELEQPQRALALMIDDALKRGQRGDGTDPKYWMEWTNRAFAAKAVVAENSVANWRDPVRRMPPEDIKPLVKAFYGAIDRFKNERANMERLWRLARGYIIEDDPSAARWAISRTRNVQGSIELVRLRTHRPVPWNDGSSRLAITLIITPDRDVSYRGQTVTVGLTEALLRLDAHDLQPGWRSLPSQRRLANFRPTAAGDADRIVGPLDPDGMIDGEPLGDEFLMTLESRDTDFARAEETGMVDVPATVTPADDAPVWPPGSSDRLAMVEVRAPRGAFKVPGNSATQTAVLNALFYEQLHERDDHDRALLARAPIASRADRCR